MAALLGIHLPAWHETVLAALNKTGALAPQVFAASPTHHYSPTWLDGHSKGSNKRWIRRVRPEHRVARTKLIENPLRRPKSGVQAELDGLGNVGWILRVIQRHRAEHVIENAPVRGADGRGSRVCRNGRAEVPPAHKSGDPGNGGVAQESGDVVGDAFVRGDGGTAPLVRVGDAPINIDNGINTERLAHGQRLGGEGARCAKHA